MNKDYTFLPHEYEHLSYLKDNAFECALFLKRDDEAFPLEKSCPITLIGNGVRHTVIGGTGSGAVNVKYIETIEDAFINEGFVINSTDWLDKYDNVRQKREKDFVKEVKKEAKELNVMAASYAVGKTPSEIDYEFPIIGDHEVAVYVLSRNAGEGADRQLKKGDVYLTDTEIRDILTLNRTYKKFILVLNTPSIIDISPVLEVKNILLISQLGSLTGHVLVDILLGRKNPCGKLSDTWAKINDYPYISQPINKDICQYVEGIYVGYRYFETKKIEPIFPFGFGLSYTRFDYKVTSISNDKDKITLKVNVTNKGEYSGKEVIQVYISGPINRPSMELVAFKKTSLISPKDSEEITISFKLSDFPSYDEILHSYVLNKGNYVVKVGNSVKNVKSVLCLNVDEDIKLKVVKNVFNKPVFEDLHIDREPERVYSLPTINLYIGDFVTTEIGYKDKYEVEITNYIRGLSIDELILICIGDYKEGVKGLIGQSCSLVEGGAGETTLRVKSLPKALNMVDGPAGLRMVREYIVNDKGVYPTTSDSIWDTISNYIPWPINALLKPERNLSKKGSVVVQIATAIPIATALAQSFNDEFIAGCADIVRKEMEIYGVDIWLAPGVNIHRHILCGRNFEYYSEDPLLTAVCASSIISTIQKEDNKATTIKHFACNNQETNRTNNNSMVSERALREIYLPAFEKAIKWSNPRSIMTSYNLVNGIHASEHRGLIIDILRNEWGYKGLVMTDWINSGQVYRKHNIYPAAFASHNIKNGNNISMPGSKADIKDIKSMLKHGYLTREDLELSAQIVVNFINELKK